MLFYGRPSIRLVEDLGFNKNLNLEKKCSLKPEIKVDVPIVPKFEALKEDLFPILNKSRVRGTAVTQRALSQLLLHATGTVQEPSQKTSSGILLDPSLFVTVE